MKQLLFFAAAFFMAMPGYAAEEKACTQMGCVNGLVLRPTEDMFIGVGHYEFEFYLPGKTVICKGELPLKPCDEGHSFQCSTRDVMITESGCALPREQHRIGDIYVYGTPQKMVMIAKKNGKAEIIRTLRPTYVFTRPNGPGCEPQCVTGTMSLK